MVLLFNFLYYTVIKKTLRLTYCGLACCFEVVSRTS
nr:MAG TPA: hypothetical protein [Caudoviricetes sp.]